VGHRSSTSSLVHLIEHGCLDLHPDRALRDAEEHGVAQTLRDVEQLSVSMRRRSSVIGRQVASVVWSRLAGA
jgi:hypothetical protein